ncbi:MAG: PaaI family thioesterase [Bacillota bacterium]
MQKNDLDHYCFGCSAKNPIGLKLEFIRDGESFYSDYTPREEFQGYPGILHGGITATLLDEVMANNLFTQGFFVVTAEMNIRYLHKIPIGEQLRIHSKILKQDRRLYEMEGWVENSQGKVLAKATGKLLSVKPGDLKQK